jgi:hypothetical protein
MSRSHDPDFVEAGRETKPKASSTPVSSTPQKSYDFLETWSIPTGGFGLWWYKTRCFLNRDTKANHQDYLRWQQYQSDLRAAKELHEQMVSRAEIDYLIRRLKWLDNQGIRAIMAFANYKSGGKTVSLLLVLSTLAEHTRRACIAIPATGNHATATLARYSGTAEFHRDTIQQLSDKLASIKNHQDLDVGLAITDAGVRIVGEDKSDANKVDNDYKLRNFVQVLLGIVPHVRYIGLDLGNDNIHRDSIGLVAPRLAHVLNFCFPHDDVILEDTIQDTVRGYNSDRAHFDDLYAMLKDSGLSDEEMFHINSEDVAKTGFSAPTVDKVAHSVVIANRAGEDDSVDFDSFMRPDQNATAVATPVWDGVGVKVPLDPYLDTKQALVREAPLSLANVSPETRRAGLLAAIANLEAAARLQGIDISDAPQFIEPPVPEVEHPFPAMLGANRKETSHE